MKISRNENCPCGSSLKYKHCCGSLASIDESNTAMKIQNIAHHQLPQSEKVTTSFQEISSLIASGQISRAQYLLQKIEDRATLNPYLLNFWGLIAYQLGCYKDAANYFHLAKSQKPEWPAPEENFKKLGISSKIASKAHVFIGNATSNPSLIISCLKKWQSDHLYLLGNNHFHDPKDFLFETILS